MYENFIIPESKRNFMSKMVQQSNNSNEYTYQYLENMLKIIP